ncbi:MAG TPA: TOBE domain-containing protein [Caulobacteraceae bacterium]|nr:TOBE domain-containing protein [Caulobacteraceae bacterium]
MNDRARAVLSLRRGDEARVGPDRIRLLEAIAAQGSISAGGKAIGLTYRAAWDAVRALNNLFGRPLVESHAGGSKGGGAVVTEAGLAVIAGFNKLQRALDDVLDDLGGSLSPPVGGRHRNPFWSIGMKTSARNALRGVVETVTEGAVNCEVTLRISANATVTAIVTMESARELELKPGREAVALIKSSFVVLAPGDTPLRTSARNQLSGVVAAHETGAVNDEVVLELDEGKTIVATITRGSAETLGFSVGERAQALVKASHVILAVD